jgi:hypothetical protein
VARREPLAVHLDRVRRREPRGPAKGLDAALGKVLLPAIRNGFGEAALERHQGRPVNRSGSGEPAAAHPVHSIAGFGDADQDLLGIAAAQGACATEWAMIDDGDGAAGGASPRARHHRRAGAWRLHALDPFESALD